jgi:hypothetical protein
MISNLLTIKFDNKDCIQFYEKLKNNISHWKIHTLIYGDTSEETELIKVQQSLDIHGCMFPRRPLLRKN